MSIGPAENAGLGPCELQDPVWAKMSALAAGVKKRKKSETKPQAQINKCNNEKRRREQENIYIEELAELISANFADMSSLSVKPDKCAILQETVNQIRSIKQREGGSQSSDPVQQGEVSSSRPAILSTDVYGPLLLEALEGFLFVVNAEGKVEHVTKNVSNYIKYTEEEVLGKSIYNFIHHGDHARFSSSLLPMPIGWASEPTNKSRSFSCRLLVKSTDDPEETVDDKQHAIRYELMHISSTPLAQGTVNDDESGESGPCLLCVASRMTYRDRAAFASVDSFTTKLETTGKIIGVDTSGVSSYCQFLNKDLMGRALQELCAQQDVHKLTQHLRDTLSAGQATSVVYRLRIGQDKFLHVQTKSKLFKSNPHSNETDFIMATHSIMGENDSSRPSDPGGGGGGGGGNNSNVGGPLMTSVVNGTRNGPPINTSAENSTSINNSLLHNTNSTVYTSFSLENELVFDNITSTWEFPWQDPDSRQSVTPVSTPIPRPPSAPTYSPGTTVAQSPITQFVTQPSPSVPNPSTPANTNLPYNSTFVFSPAPADVEEQKDTKAIVLEEPSTMMADSGRLRNLLTKPPNSTDSSNDSDKKNNHRILKTLLNQHDEDENVSDNRNSPRGNASSGRNSISGQSELPKTNTSSGGNNMLLQLLNEKSDDEDRESRAGLRKQSELLQQLLKDDDPKTEMQSEDDHLLRSLGFPPSDENRGRKRPSDDRDDASSKRSSDGVSSSGSTGSKLCERNKMLASLLAKQPNNSQPIPPIPNSVITATPQEKLPRIIPEPNQNKTLPNNNNRMIQNIQAQNVLSNARNTTTRLPGRPSSNTTYLNQILTPGDNNIQRTQNRQFNQQVDSNSFPSPAATNADGGGMWDTQNSDQILSYILDEVLDTVQDDSNILTLLEPSANNSNSYQQPLSEKMAINRIQKSLMLCETAVNINPSSPTITLPMTPPAYSTVAMTAQTNQSGFPPPPPNYPCNFNVQRAAGVRPGVGGTPQYPAGLTAQQQQQLLFQRRLAQQQQQQREKDKRRLLQQQQQQQLLIPSNATVEMQNPDLQNIGSLLNNTVAPNVSLQRSSSVPESQLSPNFGGQSQRLNSQQQPYSPHSQLTSPLGQTSGFTQTTVSNFQQHAAARLSPHPPTFTQQLSPRQAYPQGTTQNSSNWQQSTPRLSVQQQQNPMLNAQLTGNYVAGTNSRNFANVQRTPQQQPRAIGSPGAAATRHSPFPADTFAPPGSPNSTSYNQNQYLRLQRANSAPTAPTATTQLPGGLGSPRPYGRDHPPHSYPIPPQPHHSMMYQQDSQYCYDQTGLQLAYNGADRGRIPPHLQAGVSGSGTTSEYVRQELRNVVGARAGQTQPSANNRSQNTLHQAVNSDLDLGGLGYEMPTSGASESPKLWGAMGSDMGSMSPQPATSRTSMEEARQGDHSARSSLLQKLLSE